MSENDNIPGDRYYALHSKTGKTFGPSPATEIEHWLQEGRISLSDSVCKEGEEHWKKISETKFLEFAPELWELVSDVELGPVDKKLSAMIKLQGMRLSPDRVKAPLEQILDKYQAGSRPHFFAARTLAPLGYDPDTLVEVLIPYLETLDKEGVFVHFPWLLEYPRRFPEGFGGFPEPTALTTQAAAIETLSWLRQSAGASNQILRVLESLSHSGQRTFCIYALGAIGDDSARETLEYYKRRFSASLEGEAATLALEKFGSATLGQIAEAHRSLRPPQQVKQSKCFVATAVYQDTTAAQVQLLQQFRDRILIRSIGGRSAVRLYYRVGPVLSAVIGRFASLRILVRYTILEPVVAVVSAIMRRRGTDDLP